ncbi:MAG: hypothetical protein ACTS2F_09190 [Thainema sp.]
MTQRGRQSNPEFDPRQGQPSPSPSSNRANGHGYGQSRGQNGQNSNATQPPLPVDDPWNTTASGSADESATRRSHPVKHHQAQPYQAQHYSSPRLPQLPHLNGYESNGYETNDATSHYETNRYHADSAPSLQQQSGQQQSGNYGAGHTVNRQSTSQAYPHGQPVNGYGPNGHSMNVNPVHRQPVNPQAIGYPTRGQTAGSYGASDYVAGNGTGNYGVPPQPVAAHYSSSGNQYGSYGNSYGNHEQADWSDEADYDEYEDSDPDESDPSLDTQPDYRVQPPVNESSSRTFFRAFLPSLGVFKRWQFWGIVALISTTGVAGVAAAYLLRLPGLPNCPAIFLPTASASLRLYCAQVAADKRTIEDLLAAIALIEDLPDDHPMRQEIDHQLELWSVDILELAEESFHKGDLETAIATAKRIPAQTSSAKLVDERIQRWKTIWSEAESIYKQAEDALRDGNFREAFARSVDLLEVGNDYWATTRYQELTNNITSARRDGAKLVEARSMARRNTADAILEAIEMAKAIKPESYVYEEAQKAIGEFIERMYVLAIDTLDQGYSNDAISIANKIPAEGDMKTKVRDFLILARAVRQAGEGQQGDLQRAILEAQQLTANSALYSKAQQLISRWELEIQDLARLNWARQLAAPGTLGDLTAAISEAQLIPRTNPRWEEAQDEIAQWTRQVEIIEDRPYLDRAEQIATNGDTNSLKNAIAEASNIRSGRALYDDAQTKIRAWRQRVETAEDQPILEEAKMLARSGNIDAAIATAERITSGRTLYDEAQGEIRRWRNQVRGQQVLQDAYRSASIGTINGLADAIQLADQVPASSSSRSEANQMRNVWSQELLRQANAEAISDPEDAIAIAKRIPSDTSGYESAQQLIQSLESQLAPVELDPLDEAGSPIPPDVEFGTTNSR